MSNPLDLVRSGCCEPAGAAISETDADELSALLKAVADPVRLRLLSMIASAPSGEVCACDLAEPLGRSQPTVSHHLSQLVDAGLVAREQRGRWAWFSVRGESIEALVSLLQTATC